MVPGKPTKETNIVRQGDVSVGQWSKWRHDMNHMTHMNHRLSLERLLFGRKTDVTQDFSEADVKTKADIEFLIQ